VALFVPFHLTKTGASKGRGLKGPLPYHATILLFIASLAGSVAGQTTEVQSHSQRAREALKASVPEAAVKEYRAVLELDPRNIEANGNLGVIEFFRDDCQSASRYFSAALAIQPSLPKAQALLGICQKRLGDPSALASLERSFSGLTEPKLRIQVGMELMGLHYQQGNLHKAASLIQSLVELDPDNVDVLYSAQLLYTELADETLNKLAVLAPGSARMQQIVGERLVNAGDLKGAIEHYKKALALDPRLQGVRYELSQAILESSPSDGKAQTEAQALLEDAVKTEGDNARIECELGAIAVAKQDEEQGYAHYHRAFVLNPRETQAQMGLARLLMSERKSEEAVTFLRMAIESDPLNGEAHYRLALAYRDLQRAEDAQKEIRIFQDIKRIKDQVKELYRQMNKESTRDDLLDAKND
jgi:tetratricopeptide (TPR) repeat protein